MENERRDTERERVAAPHFNVFFGMENVRFVYGYTHWNMAKRWRHIHGKKKFGERENGIVTDCYQVELDSVGCVCMGNGVICGVKRGCICLMYTHFKCLPHLIIAYKLSFQNDIDEEEEYFSRRLYARADEDGVWNFHVEKNGMMKIVLVYGFA